MPRSTIRRSTALVLDLTTNTFGPAKDEAPVGKMARGLIGSEILKIAAEIRALSAKGQKLLNLTVGDFSPKEFPIPGGLRDRIGEALAAGETNYPPADGMMDLRQAVQRFYERALGLKYPLESILVAGGARPIIYGTFRAVVDPGDTVVYPVPSWNNNHYTYMLGAKPVEVITDPDKGFMPTAEQLAPHLSQARLLCLCSPLNPTGTMLSPEALKEICQLVVAENRSRQGSGRAPLILMYDQIYWVLTFGGTRHVNPIEQVPEVAPYTVFVDGISKAFAATGVRVGWGIGPPAIIARMKDVIGHTGAWAPRAEQVATARFLDDVPATSAFLENMRKEVSRRLDALYQGFAAMRERGLPVTAIAPQGAIYLSVRFDLNGKAGLESNEQIRKLLLEKAGLAVVPFQAFGLKRESGWFRLSVGAVSEAEIREALPRVETALREALR